MEQIPSPSAKPQEFVLLLPLTLGAISPFTKWPTPGAPPAAQGRTAHVPLILHPRPPSRISTAMLPVNVIRNSYLLIRRRTWSRDRRWGRWRLVSAVMD